MKRLEDDRIDSTIEDYLMNERNKKLYELSDPAKEEILRTTRYYEVDNIKDLLDDENMAELTLTEPLSKKVREAEKEAMNTRLKKMSYAERMDWERYNVDHEELKKLLEYLRYDFSVSYSHSKNPVVVYMYGVYAMKFKPEINKTWRALEFEVYDGTGGVVKAMAMYRIMDVNNDDLQSKLEMLQQLNGSQAVDITFKPLPTTYKTREGKYREAEVMIEVLDIIKVDGDRDPVFVPEPVEYNTN